MKSNTAIKWEAEMELEAGKQAFKQTIAVSTDQQEVLLHCPFCGGSRVTGTYIRDGYQLSCRKCDGSITAFMPEAKEKCITKWNKRVSINRMGNIREVLEKLLQQRGIESNSLAAEISEALAATIL